MRAILVSEPEFHGIPMDTWWKWLILVAILIIVGSVLRRKDGKG